MWVTVVEVGVRISFVEYRINNVVDACLEGSPVVITVHHVLNGRSVCDLLNGTGDLKVRPTHNVANLKGGETSSCPPLEEGG